MHLICFIIRIYHAARSSECQIKIKTLKTRRIRPCTNKSAISPMAATDCCWTITCGWEVMLRPIRSQCTGNEFQLNSIVRVAHMYEYLQFQLWKNSSCACFSFSRNLLLNSRTVCNWRTTRWFKYDRDWFVCKQAAQLLRNAACLHTNQSRSYLNHLVYVPLVDWMTDETNKQAGKLVRNKLSVSKQQFAGNLQRLWMQTVHYGQSRRGHWIVTWVTCSELTEIKT